MNKSRQQFEEFIKLHTDHKELKDRLVTVNAGKNYRNVQTDLMWIAWKESRSALKPAAFTIRDDSGYLYLNRMATQECDELNHQLNLLHKYCPEKQYAIVPLYQHD